MRSRVRAAVTAAAGAFAALLLGACGTQVAGQGVNVPPASTPVAWTTLEPSRVNGVQLGSDGRTLTIDVQVPAGKKPCMRDLKAVLGEASNNVVRVQVTYSSPSLEVAAGCTKESRATTAVQLPEPLGGQDLVVDIDQVYTAQGATPPALRLCGRLGCRPPATGCTPASYDQALLAADAPAHTYRDSQNCDGEWLVLDFSWRTGPACDDASESAACASRLGDRWFFRAAPAGWVPLTSGATGGCRAVHRVAPAFPTAMCAALPPLSAKLHPDYSSASPNR
ncbi:hypothetical protein [Actinacidiphila paucisporea]|uniref:Lipoprotein n=1 Tax=Actinacidiphila paucisporea TaxID=310782 RepID=A0A1M7PG59_9ACTN|nr:hypothetical protein [Actinacidiphila paucisporea]SHN15745.1 hypothetical protein SAMN05216499_12336 [Actinacidiphila paucisporea]